MTNEDLTPKELCDLALRVSNWHEVDARTFQGDIGGRLIIKTKTHERPYNPPSYLSYSISVHMNNHHIGTAECFPNSKRVDYLPIIRAYLEASRISAENKSRAVAEARTLLEKISGGS
ncbi:hypothetical protein HYT23_01390 [Candidatus Pacearchaeota archaeon]|nr:hypothetical protein [Candidatus Pacearchaeota archaeon]